MKTKTYMEGSMYCIRIVVIWLLARDALRDEYDAKHLVLQRFTAESARTLVLCANLQLVILA